MAPETSLYGGRPTAWVLRDRNGRTRRLLLTGHAYPTICHRLSSLFLQAWHELPLASSSFLLAGAIRCDIPVEAEGSASPAFQARVQERFEKDLREYLKENDRQVTPRKASFDRAVSYTHLSYSGVQAVVVQHVRELGSVASDVGLLRLRRGSFEAHEEAERRAALGHGLDAGPDGSSDPPAWAKLRVMARPFEVEVPRRVFGSALLEDVLRAHHTVGRHEVLADVGRRRWFYGRVLDAFTTAFRRHTEDELMDPNKAKNAVVDIHVEVDLDAAVERHLAQPRQVKASEYLEDLPSGIVGALWWRSQMEVLAEATARPAAGSGATTQLSGATFDALIRGWSLPFVDSRVDSVRQAWEQAARPGALYLLDRCLRATGLSLEDARHEGVVFLVREVAATGGAARLAIEARHVVDPAWGLPPEGLASRWERRRVEMASADEAVAMAVAHLERGEWRGAFTKDDGTIVDAFAREWAALLRCRAAQPSDEDAYIDVEYDLLDDAQQALAGAGSFEKQRDYLGTGFESRVKERPNLPELRLLRVQHAVHILRPFLPYEVSGTASDLLWRTLDAWVAGTLRFVETLEACRRSDRVELRAMLKDDWDSWLKLARTMDGDLKALRHDHAQYFDECLAKRRIARSIAPILAAAVDSAADDEGAVTRLVLGACSVMESQAHALQLSVDRLKGHVPPLAVLEALETEVSSRRTRWGREILRLVARHRERAPLADLAQELDDLRMEILADAETWASYLAVQATSHGTGRVIMARLRWLRGDYRAALAAAAPGADTERSGTLPFPLGLVVLLAGGRVIEPGTENVSSAGLTMADSTPTSRVADGTPWLRHPGSGDTLGLRVDADGALTVVEESSGLPLLRLEGLTEGDARKLVAHLGDHGALRKPPPGAGTLLGWAKRLPAPALGPVAVIGEALASEWALSDAVYHGVEVLGDTLRRGDGPIVVGVNVDAPVMMRSTSHGSS